MNLQKSSKHLENHTVDSCPVCGAKLTETQARERRRKITGKLDDISKRIDCLVRHKAALGKMESTYSKDDEKELKSLKNVKKPKKPCLLYTSPSPRDRQKSRMPSSA